MKKLQQNMISIFGLTLILGIILSGCKKESVDPEPEIQIPISDNSYIRKIEGGEYHTMLIKKDGTLWATGDNAFGGLGTGEKSGRTTFVQVLMNVKDVACGKSHTLALKNDGTLWATGYNKYGQLGTSDNDNRISFIKVLDDIIAMDAGSDHSLVITKDSILLACGLNSNGQLGISDKQNVNYFREIMKAENVAAGTYNSFAIVDGDLYAAGCNVQGQLGAFDYEDQAIFRKITASIKKVCSGFAYTIAMTESGSVKYSGLGDYEAWSDSKGISNITEKTDLKIRDMSAGQYHYLVVSDSVLYGIGQNDIGQMGINVTKASDYIKLAENVSRAFTGYYSSWYIDTDGVLWATGSNSRGELGTGDKVDISGFIKVDLK